LLNHLRPALVLVVLLTLLTGLGYPLLVTGIAGVAFPDQAPGSLLRRPDGKVIGSRLIGQGFAAAGYFHPRPSAAGSGGYDAAASGGSNLGPTSKALVEAVGRRVAALRADGVQGPVPADLVTASGSGLDPHLSPAAALVQVPRVAAARNLPEGRVRTLVEEHAKLPVLGILGEPHVNVLELNLALDRLAGSS
jgi:K+-transporting ATPase ATPase C chain